jgi:scyllo-inositol 2-dehydrogenase (NADP+)
VNKTTFRVGLIGWGNGGRFFHAPLVHVVDGLDLVAVVTSRAEVKDHYPGIKVLDSVDALLADPAIDLVVVATPHLLHVPHAQAALQAGKHVVVEKPLAQTADEAAALVEQARAADRLLITYHNRRWDSDFLTVQKVIQSGALGDIYYFESNWSLYRPSLRGVWREDPSALGGVLYDLGPHMVDQALLLFGQPDTVYAQVESHRPGCKVDDVFRMHLRFPSGVSVVLVTDMLAPFPGPRFQVRGQLGTYEKHGHDPQEAALRAGEMPTGEDWGAEDPGEWGRIWTADLGGLPVDGRVAAVPGDYREFYRAVYRAMLEGGPAPIDPADVILQLRVIEAALKSAQTNTVQSLD